MVVPRGVGLSLKQLKEMQDEDTLELDMQDLEIVPVMLLNQLKRKPLELNLSRNKLITLGDDFCSLTQLVKLDLSQNQLTRLPDNFGKLKALQHLDLYKNNITTLPVSMASLKALRWMDVKDNPLDDDLSKVAGQCLDVKQCQAAATKVVQFLGSKQSETERRKQKGLTLERERQAEENRQVEAERKRQKEAKKLDKEKKRKEKADENHRAQMSANKKKKEQQHQANGKHNWPKKKAVKVSRQGWCSWIFWLLLSLVRHTLMATLILTLLTSFVLFINCNRDKQFIPNSGKLCKQIYSWAREGGPRPAMEEVNKAAVGMRILLDQYRERAYVLAKGYGLDVYIDKGRVLVGNAVSAVQEASAPYVKLAIPYTEWLWKETKVWGNVALKYTIQYSKIGLQYTVMGLTYAAETTKDVVQNYPQYWEKVKLYWQNIK